MSKQKKQLLAACVCLLLIKLFIWLYQWLFIDRVYQVERVYTWLVQSHLIDPEVDKKHVGADEKNEIVDQIKLENGISITQYQYNREDYLEEQKRIEKESSKQIVWDRDGDEIAIRKLSVWIPDGHGSTLDFKKVLNAKKPLPNLRKMYASNKAKIAAETFRQNKPFSDVADAFNTIETNDFARQTFYSYLKNQSVTWTGKVIEVDEYGSVHIHGKPNLYQGPSMDYSASMDRVENPALLRYVFTAIPQNRNDFSSLQTGDTVTIKGTLYDYGYQSEEEFSKWFVSNAVVIKHVKAKDFYTYIDPNQAFQWFRQSGLTLDSDTPVISQTMEDGQPVTHLVSPFVRISSYTYNRALEVETSDFIEKEGGKEFSIENLTVFISHGVTHDQIFKKVLKSRQPELVPLDSGATMSIEIKQTAVNVDEKKDFKSTVDSFYRVPVLDQKAVFQSYMKGKPAEWRGSVVQVESRRLILYGLFDSSPSESTKFYLFSARLAESEPSSTYKKGDIVKVAGTITQYTDIQYITLWELSDAHVLEGR